MDHCHQPYRAKNYTCLEIGDLVHMQEVLENSQSRSRLAFEGQVIALQKREGLIYVLCIIVHLLSVCTLLLPQICFAQAQDPPLTIWSPDAHMGHSRGAIHIHLLYVKWSSGTLIGHVVN
jgi:hypothetical protein